MHDRPSEMELSDWRWPIAEGLGAWVGASLPVDRDAAGAALAAA
jgi:hypothetical protein